MNILVSGILKTPMGEPLARKDIRIVTKGADGETLPHTLQVYTTLEDGSYSFELLQGTYYCEVLLNAEYHLSGDLRVDSATPSPIDLPTLVRYSYPIDAQGKPTYPPEWDVLIEFIDTSPSTRKRIKRDQIVDDLVHVTERKETQVNDTHDMRMGRDTKDLASCGANVYKEDIVYSDGDGNQLAGISEGAVSPNGDSTSHKHVDTLGSELRDTVSHGSKLLQRTLEANGDEISMRHDITTDTSSEKYFHTHGSIGISMSRTEATGNTKRTKGETAKGDLITQLVSLLADNGIDRSEILESLDATPNSTSWTRTNNINGYQSSDMDVNTSSYTERSLTYDNLNVKRLSDGSSIFIVDTVTPKVTVNATMVINGLEDPDGNPIIPEDGDTIFQVSQWSDSPSGPWEDAPEPWHIWRRDNWSVNGVIDPNGWSNAYKIRGEDGENGDTISIEYNYSPDGATNWSPTLKAGDKYRRERTVTNGVPGAWSDPALIVGDDGSTVEVRSEYSVNGLDDWHPIVTPLDKYERRGTFVNGVQDGPWSDPFPIGKGDTGSPGLPGSGWYTIIDGVGDWPGDAQATIDFTNNFGRAPLENDHLMYVDTNINPTNQSIKRCDSPLGQPITWAQASLIVTGDMIVTGTISAYHLVAKTITGNKISSATTIIAGTASETAGMNGSDEAMVDDPYDDTWPPAQIPNIYQGYRFWSGSSDPSTANWRVFSDGRMEALDVLARGEIRATTGWIEQHMTIGTNVDPAVGRVRLMAGTANTDSPAIDVYTNGSPRFELTHNGILRMWNHLDDKMLDFDSTTGVFIFKGRVIADEIEGDVVSALALTAGPARAYSSGASTFFDSVRVVEAKPYARTLEIAVSLAAYAAPASAQITNAHGNVRVTGTFGTHNSVEIGAVSDRYGNVSRTVVMAIPVPANVAGTANIYSHCRSVSNIVQEDTWIEVANSGNRWVAKLFRDGNGLAP